MNQHLSKLSTLRVEWNVLAVKHHEGKMPRGIKSSTLFYLCTYVTLTTYTYQSVSDLSHNTCNRQCCVLVTALIKCKKNKVHTCNDVDHCSLVNFACLEHD